MDGGNYLTEELLRVNANRNNLNIFFNESQ